MMSKWSWPLTFWIKKKPPHILVDMCYTVSYFVFVSCELWSWMLVLQWPWPLTFVHQNLMSGSLNVWARCNEVLLSILYIVYLCQDFLKCCSRSLICSFPLGLAAPSPITHQVQDAGVQLHSESRSNISWSQPIRLWLWAFTDRVSSFYVVNVHHIITEQDTEVKDLENRLL